MKKSILYSMIAWLLFCSHAVADDLVISDVTVPQGGTAELTVGYKFTSTTEKVGFTFQLDMPTGISILKDGDGDPVYTKDECISKFNILFPKEGDFAAQPSKETSVISGTEGTLLTLYIKADASLEVGSTHVVNVKKSTFQQRVEGVTTDINIADFTFTVTVGEPADTRMVLDETSTTPPSAATGVDVRVKRTIKANEWSTLVLPFSMTAEQVTADFGDDVQLADFTSWSSEEDNEGDIVSISVEFDAIDAIEANHPCLIRVSSAISEFTVDGVDIDPEDEPTVQVGKKKAERGYLTGTYVAQTVVPEYNLFLSENKFWYSTGLTKMKAFRAYFEFADVLAEVENSSSAANVRVTFVDESVTGISDIAAKQKKGVYTLQGVALGEKDVKKLPKGMYVVDGKKVVKN